MALGGQHQLRTTHTFLSGTSAAHYLPYRVQPAIYHTKGNQLQFNRDVPTHPYNLATQFSNPSPIVIEKLGTSLKKVGRSDEDDPSRHSSPSISFSVISEERLNLAVWLAKRDLKRKHLVEKQELIQSSPVHKGPTQLRTEATSKADLKAKPNINKGDKKALKAEVTKSGAQVYVYTSSKNGIYPPMSDSPPTHDLEPESRTIPETVPEPSEMKLKQLQKEMCTYMQKIEELTHKENPREILEPEEQARGRIRQKERAAHSARILYVLQQQVKEIQEELDQPQKTKHTKKSRTMSRLAAVYRGAIRALQLFVTQLSERGEQQVPALYKELGHVIRQLTLCTAKLETGSDPAASSTIFSILQQAEDLDLLLDRKVFSQGRRASPNKATSRSPSAEKRDNNDLPARPPIKEKKGPPPIFKQRMAREKSEIRKQPVFDHTPESLTTGTQTEPISAEDPPTPERRAALRSGLEALIKAGGLKGIPRTGVGHNGGKGVLLPHKPQGYRQPRRTQPYQGAHFQKKTVAFALKENRPPVKEKRAPWLPPNKTSPPTSPKKINVKKEDKRLNLSPAKMLDNDSIPTVNQLVKEDAIAKEAVRLAWLDAETARRIQELDNLYREEMSHLQNARKFREQLLQASDLSKTQNTQRPQTANKADQLENVIIKGSLGRDQCSREENSGIQDADLEAMIQRIEEIEKFQEIVQRRNQATYADPEFWAQEEKDRTSAGKETIPQTPHPIMITKPTGQREPIVDIFLEEPFEGDSLQVSKEELARSSPLVLPERPIVRSEGLIEISVPTQMLQNIKNNRDAFERHLQLTSDRKEGSFDSRYIFESIADDIWEEALNEVAAEYLDLCDSYADALYTSEFLEPLKTH